jgi:hypothetical protein
VAVSDREWSWLTDAGELRIMQLPDRKSPYLVLIDDRGMHAVARFLGDVEATDTATWLADAIERDAAPGIVQQTP